MSSAIYTRFYNLRKIIDVREIMSIFIFIAGSRVTPSPTFRLASVEVSAYPSTGPLLRYCSMFMVCLPVYRALA